MNQPSVLSTQAICCSRGSRQIIRDVSLDLTAGESVALMGPSGCGKTTLLHLLGLLEAPTLGTVTLDGRDPWLGSSDSRADLRLARIGFVFQQSNLMPFLTARQNVALPAWRYHGSHHRASAQATELLTRFGLGHRLDTRAGLLSLGEAQRVATARALVNHPTIILADEPTGSLDSEATKAVLDSLDAIVAQGTALLVATHDPRVAERAQRIVHMEDGAMV